MAKAGNGRQYLWTLIFNHCDVTGMQQSNRNRWKNAKYGYYAIQGRQDLYQSSTGTDCNFDRVSAASG